MPCKRTVIRHPQVTLQIASGNPLPLAQSNIALNGHAFEARIYAENARNNFLPDVGRLLHIRQPKLGPSVRLDNGYQEGDEMSIVNEGGILH